MADVRLEDIQSALSQWARQEVELKDQNRLLIDRIEELTLLLRHGISHLRQSFGLAERPTAELQHSVDEALLATTAASSERIRLIETQKDEIERLRAKVAGLEQEQQESINRIVEVMELPRNPHRTLRNATTDAVEMVTEAKKMVRENL